VRHQKKSWGISPCWCLFFTLLFLIATSAAASQKQKSSLPKTRASSATKKAGGPDDSSNSKPAADLALRLEGAHKADALTHFVEGMSLEENGETDRALEAYRKVLNVDPGQ
jgi:Flp pilus assembly protein TadD